MDELMAIKELVLWFREQRVMFQRLKVGDVEIDALDLQLQETETQAANQDIKEGDALDAPTPNYYGQILKDRGFDA